MMDKSSNKAVTTGKWAGLYGVRHVGADTKKILKEVIRENCGRFLRREGNFLIFDSGIDGSPEEVIRVVRVIREGKTPAGEYRVADYKVDIRL